MTDRAQRLLTLAGELGLTDKQRRFAEALASDPDANQTRAAEAAGLGKPWAVQGAKMVKIGKVQKYIAAIHAETGLTEVRGQALERSIASREEVLESITGRMRFDVDSLLNEEGSFDLQKARELKATKHIREITIEEDVIKAEGDTVVLKRKTKLKGYDAQKAEDMLARHHKIYAEEGGGAEATTLGELAKAMDAAARLALYSALLRGQAAPVVNAEAKRIG